MLKEIRSKLDGKVLCISLKEFQIPLLIFVFDKRQVDILYSWEGDTDCSLIIHSSLLSKFHCHQQLNTLISNGDIEIVGDFQIAQNLFNLINLAAFDPIELLVPYIGDVAAEGFSKMLYRSIIYLFKLVQNQQRYIIEALTEELRVAPGCLEMAWFVDEVTTFKYTVAALAKHLENGVLNDFR